MKNNDTAFIQHHMTFHANILQKMQTEEMVLQIKTIAQEIKHCFDRGGKLLICGNGGSAADAQHLAAEFVVRFETDRKALPAIALNGNSSSLTAIVNDFEAERIYERQVEAFGQEKDLLIAISTSGNSANIVRAIARAKERNMFVVSFLGKGGGLCKGLADVELIVPCDTTSYIQEMHIMIIHMICELIDKYYMDEKL